MTKLYSAKLKKVTVNETVGEPLDNDSFYNSNTIQIPVCGDNI